MQVQSPAADEQVTLLTPSGYQHVSCGYCNSESEVTRASVGATSSSLQPLHYQALINRGWRRLDAVAFAPTKDQRKAINRWNQYILGQDYKEKAARLCPRSRQEKKWRRNRFDLSDSVHACEYQNVKKPIDRRTQEVVEPAHKFEINLEPDNFTEEKYALFANYQKNTHGESDSDFSRLSFKRFLCSGMKQSVGRTQGIEQKLGSFHQCYRLDKRLVAMGVLDLLPECVSSVYLMYHKDFSDWNFGKLSAMREIDLTLQGGYKFYYMGYYIHSCVKMRYKGDFKPTYVLDPENHAWDLLDSDLFQRMSARRFVSMSRERKYNIPIVCTLLESEFSTDSAQNEDLANTFKSLDEYLTEQGPHPILGFRQWHSSVFQAGTRGVMSLADVEREIDLGKWKIKLGDIDATLEDLDGWDGSETSDVTTIKGIAAELAACIGPDLVKQTMIEFPYSDDN